LLSNEVKLQVARRLLEQNQQELLKQAVKSLQALHGVRNLKYAVTPGPPHHLFKLQSASNTFKSVAAGGGVADGVGAWCWGC
jgi:hypothetical protein